MNKTIVIKDCVAGTISNTEAVALKIELQNALVNFDVVTLDFSEVKVVTSSFLNSSLGEVVSNMGIENLKGRLNIKNCSSQLASVIAAYMTSLKNVKLQS